MSKGCGASFTSAGLNKNLITDPNIQLGGNQGNAGTVSMVGMVCPHTWCEFGGYPMQGQESDSIIPIGPFQFRTLYDCKIGWEGGRQVTGFMSSPSTLCLLQISTLTENYFRANQKLFKGALPHLLLRSLSCDNCTCHQSCVELLIPHCMDLKKAAGSISISSRHPGCPGSPPLPHHTNRTLSPLVLGQFH